MLNALCLLWTFVTSLFLNHSVKLLTILKSWALGRKWEREVKDLRQACLEPWLWPIPKLCDLGGQLLLSPRLWFLFCKVRKAKVSPTEAMVRLFNVRAIVGKDKYCSQPRGNVRYYTRTHGIGQPGIKYWGRLAVWSWVSHPPSLNLSYNHVKMAT